jgi:hypothetical protein
MAKSTVGSLYYQVILDPNGFARGATKIRSEASSLKESIKRMDQSMTGRETFKAQMLERVRVLRKLRQEGKISADYFKRLYKGEARAYKMYQEKMVADGQAAAKRRMAIAQKEARRRVMMQKEANDRLRSGAAGFMPMMKAHMTDIKKGFAQGGFIGLTQVANSLQGMFMKFWPFLLGWQILLGIVRKIVGMFKAIVGAADRKKKQLIMLTTLMQGNRVGADKLRNSLVAYAKATAFSVEQTMQLAVQMKALGVLTRDIPKNMKLFGTLAMGDPAKFRLIAKAYTDVKSLGRLMGREVIQFANQGVPILMELANMYKITTAELMAMIEAGNVSFNDVDKALQRIKERFGDIDRAALETATGQWDALKENWQEFLADGGGGMADFFMNIFKAMNQTVDWFREIQKGWGERPQWVQDLLLIAAGPIGWSAMFNTAEEWIGRTAWLAELLGTSYGADNYRREQELLRISEQRKQMAAEEAELRKEMHEDQLELLEGLKKQQKLLEYSERKKAEYLAEVKDDPTMLAEVNGKEAIRKAYREALEMGLGPDAARNQAQWAKEREMAKLEEKDAAKKDKEGSLGSLPQQIMRQNSVEEYRFIQSMRKAALAETNADRRAAQNNTNRDTNTQLQIDAIDNLNISNVIDESNFNMQGI